MPMDLAEESLVAEVKQEFGKRRLNEVEGDSNLHLAVKMGHTLAAWLYTQINDVDELNGAGFAPLHLAVQNGSVEIVLQLLRAGATRDILDALHRTPLWHAEKGHPAIRNELIKLLQSTHKE